MSSDSKTKYLILVPDGMADSCEEQGGLLTCLEESKTPWMDRMAAAGIIGVTTTIPEGMTPASDIANLSIMGYDPREVYSGRAPLEAASMGVFLRQRDLAFRLNLVTLDRNFTVMADHSADHISTPEARELIGTLGPEIESLGFSVTPGVSYRHLLIWENGPDGILTHPPHDFPGQPIASKFPTGPGADKLIRLIIKSWKILDKHPVNLRRVKRCQGPANSVWPWGQGKPPLLKTLKERYGISGSVVAAVDLIKGLGKYAGLEIVNVQGATGYLDTNYHGKAQATIEELKRKDFVFLHVEAPDEAGHSGQKDLKVKAIEDFDEKIITPIMEGLKQFDSWRILIMPDHQTPVTTRVHERGKVPFLLLDSESWKKFSGESSFSFTERTALSSGHDVPEASKMIEILLDRQKL
ncbi:MAG: cofactor-independent phosphoglycerate mutase [Desulfomonilaceae bacterium]